MERRVGSQAKIEQQSKRAKSNCRMFIDVLQEVATRVSTARGSERGSRKELLRKPRSLPLAVLTRSVTLILKIQLQRELNNPRIDRRGRNHAKSRRRDVGAGITKLRRVEGVEKLRAKFEVCAFAQSFQ